jgi:hypothetical protein
MAASPPRLRLGRLPGVVSSCFGVSRVEGAWPERKFADDEDNSTPRRRTRGARKSYVDALPDAADDDEFSAACRGSSPPASASRA